MRDLFVCGVLVIAAACTPRSSTASEPVAPTPTVVPAGHATAVVAGGCFWCIESDLESVAGVDSVISGYAGGESSAPTYQQVSSGSTQHLEVVQVVYDPSVISYEALMERFWRAIDPTQADGQFCDRGHQYTSAIFVNSAEERAVVQAQKLRFAEQLQQTIATDIRDAATFWPAEEYHQDYAKKNPSHYLRYRTACGRDARVRQIWGVSGL